jgi:hypothetical protein
MFTIIVYEFLSTTIVVCGEVLCLLRAKDLLKHEIELTQTPMFRALRFGEYNFVHVDREIT